MDILAILADSYDDITILSENSPSGNELRVYKNEEFLGQFVTVGYPQPIPTTAFTKPLVFGGVNTSEGFRYAFRFLPTDIGQDGPMFESGVYHFEIADTGKVVSKEFGVIQDREIQCCLASSIKPGEFNCGKLVGVDKVNEVNALLVGARASMRINNPTTANCLFKLAEYECQDCGCNE